VRLQDISFGERIVRVYGKGAKERIVPFGKTAMAHFIVSRPASRCGETRGVLFLNARGTPLSPSAPGA